ncbi:restriction endonuclease subunit S [Shewanella sp. UCD-KL12]|uniref:restriction endonuclease subunit S n=1 Tax=Shewanella sp. UCD-KL12 TaxID=1917163 RepID=UPI00097046A2|nr:restriction endonuclease subunit S [Shewanella sp. UCD-KL12]
MGWPLEKLQSLCDVFTDGDWIESKNQSTEGVRLVQTGNVGEGQFKDRRDKARFISEATFIDLKCCEIHEGDCLVSRLPDPVGRSCILPNTGEKMITAVDCTILRFNKNLMIPEFFNYFSQSNSYLMLVESLTSGATRKRISRKNLGLVEIPTPSIPEQKRIVALLDTVFADLEQTRAKTEQNLKNARELFDSYLQQVFSQKGEGWEQKKWGDMCKFIRGPFGGSLKKSMFKSEGYAVYEQKHAIHDHIEQLRYFVDEEKFEEMKRFELKPGELIMSCSGVTLGRASVIPKGAPKGIINQALLKLTANDDLDIHFLKYWIRSKIFQDIIFEHAGGAAIPNVPAAKILKEIKLQIPTLEKQKIIVSEIDSMVSKRDSLLRIYTEKLAALDELKKSILQKAFSGELTHD